MTELVIYSILLFAVLGHAVASAKMYKKVNQDRGLTFKQKNDWKLKALIFPVLVWFYYRQEKKRRIS
jgi:hypothetical protein